MAFSFTMGLWLYRVRDRAPKLRLGWVALSAVLVLAFAMPLVLGSVPHGNGLYEAAVAMLLFPTIILCGAHSDIGRVELALCKFAGRISYPLYLVHVAVGFQVILFGVMRGWSTATGVIAACAASLTLATLLHYLVELPGQRWARVVLNRPLTRRLLADTAE